MYTTKDLAVIIPTKDRPVEVKRHLQSIVKQKCKLGRIVVVASGEDIKDIVESFKDSLPVEYYRSEPGQIRQRNLGILKLDERTKLVASMDDDVTYHEDVLTKNEALEILLKNFDTREQRIQKITNDGSPAYTTSAGKSTFFGRQ